MSKFKTTRTGKGWPIVEFKDSNRVDCYIQASSAIGDYKDSFDRPGTSFLWLGVKDANPKIMSRDAIKLGLPAKKNVGWMPFEGIPEEVLFTTQMHLNRDEVKGLIKKLKEWLKTGSFKGDNDDRS